MKAKHNRAIVRDAIATGLPPSTYDDCAQAFRELHARKAQRDALLSEARDLVESYIDYVNSDDADLPDISGLEQAIARCREEGK
jgi:hypothetical protein